MNAFVFAALAGLSAATLPSLGDAACDVHSGKTTTALVELYTSEGCSSCPPADRLLGHLPQLLGPSAAVVPLALHVGYWDDLGWKDPYAQDIFARRQDWLAHANVRGQVYTPQFFVSGTESSAATVALADRVRTLNALPAPATLHLNAAPEGLSALSIRAQAKMSGEADTSALYVAITENGLVSQVNAGENRGTTLSHDHVVRLWIGPLNLVHGSAQLQRDVPLPQTWNRGHLEVIAFVEDVRSGHVVQAVRATQCAGS
ncbi:MAG: DUF1223 domain-containing protein [Thiobacillaceae bacterium]